MPTAASRHFTSGFLSALLFLVIFSGFSTHNQFLQDSGDNNASSSLDYLEIIGPESSVRADESVPLDLIWHDRNGNNQSVLLPLSNWTAENGNFIVNGSHVEWLPTLIGTWEISVHAEGEQATIEVTVVNGSIAMVWIDAEYEEISADDETSLVLQAEDSRGNRWQISAEWSTVEAEVSSNLVSDSSGTRFVAELVGQWNIDAVHHHPDGDLYASIMIEVTPGSLIRIELPTDGTTVSTDDAVILAPILTDADGNTIDDVTINWTVDGEDLTQEIVMAGNIWQPEETGDFLIEAEAQGRVARARMHVIQGQPHRIVIETDLTTSTVTESGVQFNVTTFAEDLDGNREPCQVNWTVPEDSIEFEETSWTGVYLARGLGKGNWEFNAKNATATGSLLLEVEVGEPIDLRIGQHSGGGDQGDSISMLIELIDYGGNQVPMDTKKLDVTTDVGRLSYDGDYYWLLSLDESGDSQSVTIRYDDFEAQTFVDVEPTGLDRLIKTTSGQLLLGGFGAAFVLVIILLFIIKRNRTPEAHWEMEYEIESDIGNQDSVESHDNEGQIQQNQTPHTANAVNESQQQTASGSGVLQALSGTIQGQSGWYLSTDGENQYWEVNAHGQWNRRG